MKNKLISALLLTLFCTINLNAQILDVKQLFNRKLVKVKQEQIGALKSFYGTTVIDESKIIDIVTRFDGFVTKINANQQLMRLKKGDTLFSIYSDEVVSVQKELQVSSEVNRYLYQSSLEKLQALDIDKNEITRLQTENSVTEVHIKTKSDAIVLKKNINQGSFVKKGALLYRLADIDTLWFIAQVYQKDLSFLKKGMSSKIRLDGINKTYKATIDYIYPMIDKQKKTVDVRFIVQNENMKLFPNMFGVVKLQNTKRTMLTLPKTAVLTKGNKYFVFKPISKEEFEPIEVEAKRISSSKYEIVDGLKVGDEVINNALFLLDSDAVTNGLYEEDDDDW